jgi:hypothetical protein
MVQRLVFSIAAVCLAAGLVSCGDPVGPGVEPQIVNNPQSFEFQVSQVSNYSGMHVYTWSNSEISANLDESVSLSGGSVRLTVIDPQGTVVHNALLEDGSLATSEGQVGDWAVRVQFEGATGTVNFRLQPRTP